MADDETPQDDSDNLRTLEDPLASAELEPEPGPFDPWAAINAWAERMLADPPMGIVPFAEAWRVVQERSEHTDIRGAWLDAVEIWGFHMHLRAQPIPPQTLRRGNIDDETWFRLPQYPVGAPQNRLWLGVTAQSVRRLLGVEDEVAESEPARTPEPEPARAPAPAQRGPAQPEDEADLTCRLCELSSHGHWLLLSLGGRLVQVCLGCAREVASAVRRK